MTVKEARRLALALPEAVEALHHGRPSFRVRGKIFATLWDERHMNVMVDAFLTYAAVKRDPKAYAMFQWGGRTAALSVALKRVNGAALSALLDEAWGSKVPKAVAAARDAPP